MNIKCIGMHVHKETISIAVMNGEGKGLQGRSATGLNDQAAKDEVSALWRGAGCRKIFLAFRQGEVFFT